MNNFWNLDNNHTIAATLQFDNINLIWTEETSPFLWGKTVSIVKSPEDFILCHGKVNNSSISEGNSERLINVWVDVKIFGDEVLLIDLIDQMGATQ